ALQPGNARVIDPAEAPLFPYKPNIPLACTLGLMGGMFLGLVWVSIRDKGEVNVECPGQAQTVLQASELGVVPSARLDPYLNGGHRERRALAQAAAEMRGGGIKTGFETAAWFCKSSLVAESVRSIRTSLLARPGMPGTPSMAVVTSLTPGQGKTSIVSNLGIA